MNTGWIFDTVKEQLFLRSDDDIVVTLKEDLLLKIHSEISTDEMIISLDLLQNNMEWERSGNMGEIRLTMN